MYTINEISLMIAALIRIGCVARFIYCMIRLSAAEEEATQYKKRAKNTVLFYIIAESIWQIRGLVIFYYG